MIKDPYANIKTIFLTEALNNVVTKSDREYKHKLKYIVGQLKTLYKADVVKDMVKMYDNHEEAFEIISTKTEEIAVEIAKVKPNDYDRVVDLLRRFNAGELYK